MQCLYQSHPHDLLVQLHKSQFAIISSVQYLTPVHSCRGKQVVLCDQIHHTTAIPPSDPLRVMTDGDPATSSS